MAPIHNEGDHSEREGDGCEPVDWQLNDTYFIVAHFHYVLFSGSAFALMGGLYYWVPKFTGRTFSEARQALLLEHVRGIQVTFLIQHSAGLSGMPRRIYDYPDELGVSAYNLISTIGSFILGVGVVMVVANLLWSAKHGRERAMTHGRATRSSGLPPRRHRRTTSTSSPASAASSP